MMTNDSKDQGREALSDEQLAALKAAAIIATPQDIDGAERIEHFTDGSRYLECPVCGGEGTVNLEGDFCNYDGHALGVEFYGIGPEFGMAEAYFRAVKPATVLALIERLERAEAALATSASALARDEASVLTDEVLRKALSQAWNLGQTYWQQADSDSYKQQDKSDVTRQKYLELVEETVALLDTTAGDSQDARAAFAQAAIRMLEGYAESYESMSRMNGGGNTVHCSSVAIDIRNNMAGWIKARAASSATAPLTSDSDAAPEWIVNDLGELGVKVGSRFFFLYKGGNLEYGADAKDGVALHDDGTPMHYRIVGKREFGETCHPLAWVQGNRSEDRYIENLVYHPGLSFGKPEDGDWKPLPSAQSTNGEQS